MPYSADAERAILAAGLLDKAAVMEAATHVAREDFYLEQHRLIFTASQALVAEGQPVDIVPLMDFLTRQQKLEAAGGGAYLGELMSTHAKVSNLAHYAKIVRDHARRRAIVAACAKLEEAAMLGEEEATKLLEQGAGSFLSMMSQDGAASMPSTWEDACNSAMEEIVGGIRNPHSVMRLNCGAAKLDRATGGLRRELVLGVGMTSHGKSTLAMQFAIDGDNQGKQGLILSAEMTKEALATRELSHASNVPLFLLRRPEEIRNVDRVILDLTEAAVRERGRKLLVVDRDITPQRVWSLCEMVHRSRGLDFVIVDYDQLVVRAGLKPRDDEFRAQAEFMAEALKIQKRLNLCFMLLCQPRKVDDDVKRGRKPPTIDQIFGSSAAGNTAHVVWWIMRKFFTHNYDPMFEDQASCYMLKMRNDKPSSVDIKFDSDRVLFSDAPDLPPPTTDDLPAGRAAGRKKAKKGEDE